MSTIENNAEVAPASQEDRFFGVKTEIKRSSDTEQLPAPEVIIEAEEGTPAAKAAEKPPEKKLTAKEKDDAELASYSAGVQKRIKKMRWQQGEVERERDAIRDERDEAFRVAQTLHGQNQQFVHTISTGEARLVASLKKAASNDLQMAKSEYATAYEKGDSAAIIDAQEKMLNASHELRTATQYETEYKGRQAQQRPPMPQPPAQGQQVAPVQRQVPSVPKPTEEAATWADENPWFGDPEHPDMTALAYGVHENLIKQQGVKPDTPEYFEKINSAMRQRFPEHFTEEKVDPPPKKTPATIVGSAQKQTPKNAQKITLKASQVRLSKRLGLTVEQYAAQLMKEGNVA